MPAPTDTPEPSPADRGHVAALIARYLPPAAALQATLRRIHDAVFEWPANPRAATPPRTRG